MKSFTIRLRTIEDVKDFVNVVTGIEGDVSLASKKYNVDAKSIMGIFSLDLREELRLDIEEWKDEYLPMLERYIQ